VLGRPKERAAQAGVGLIDKLLPVDYGFQRDAELRGELAVAAATALRWPMIDARLLCLPAQCCIRLWYRDVPGGDFVRGAVGDAGCAASDLTGIGCTATVSEWVRRRVRWP
jgi:hypothetical protein